MLVCKLIQALSNRLVVKSKEDFMLPLEGFVEDNIPVVDAFYKEIEVCLFVVTEPTLLRTVFISHQLTSMKFLMRFMMPQFWLFCVLGTGSSGLAEKLRRNARRMLGLRGLRTVLNPCLLI